MLADIVTSARRRGDIDLSLEVREIFDVYYMICYRAIYTWYYHGMRWSSSTPYPVSSTGSGACSPRPRDGKPARRRSAGGPDPAGEIFFHTTAPVLYSPAMDERRLHILNDTAYAGGPVIYWMSRDQRARDNWALVYARSRALEYRARLLVFFCLSTAFLGARKEHYAFMLEGLREVEADLRSLGIPFFLKTGDPMIVAPAFMTKMKAGLVVTDFDPLRIKRRWRESLADGLRVPVHEIDAHNIVPCRAASPKQEYGAHTLRKKLQRLLPEFLVPVPALKKFNGPGECAPVDWERAYREAGSPGTEASVSGSKAGRAARFARCAAFSKGGSAIIHGHATIRRRPASRGFLPIFISASSPPSAWPSRRRAPPSAAGTISWNSSSSAGSFRTTTACTTPTTTRSRGSPPGRGRRSTGTAATGASTSTAGTSSNSRAPTTRSGTPRRRDC